MILYVFNIYLFYLSTLFCISSAEDVWEQDLSKDMEIHATTDGYDRVGLKCKAEHMNIELKTTDDFSGVIYTQGSFHTRKSPCFLDSIRGRSFTMNIPLHKCKTEQEGDKYSNILVVQHDKELITPGDAAFNLECDFSVPINLTVTANLNTTKKSARASIALVDPSFGSNRNKRAAFIQSETDEVILLPDIHRKKKDEL